MTYRSKIHNLFLFQVLFLSIGCSNETTETETSDWQYSEGGNSNITLQGYYEVIDHNNYSYYGHEHKVYKRHYFYTIKELKNSYFSRCPLRDAKPLPKKPDGFLVEKASELKVNDLYDIFGSVIRLTSPQENTEAQAGSRAAFMEVTGKFITDEEGEKVFRIISYSIDPCKTAAFTTGCAVPKKNVLCVTFRKESEVAAIHPVQNYESLGKSFSVEKTGYYNARYQLNIAEEDPENFSLSFDALAVDYLLTHNTSLIPTLKSNAILGAELSPDQPPIYPGFDVTTFNSFYAGEDRTWRIDLEKPSWLLLSPSTETHRLSLFARDSEDESMSMHVWGTLPLENTLSAPEGHPSF